MSVAWKVIKNVLSLLQTAFGKNLTAVFFETGAMSVPTKSQNPTIYG
jgi:hypothetical protein